MNETKPLPACAAAAAAAVSTRVHCLAGGICKAWKDCLEEVHSGRAGSLQRGYSLQLPERQEMPRGIQG